MTHDEASLVPDRDRDKLFSRHVVLLSLVALVIGVGAGATLAAWLRSDLLDFGRIAAGDLDIVAESLTWSLYPGQSGSTDDPALHTPMVTGSGASSLHALVLTAGDRLVIEQAISVTLDGDNLVAELSVETDADMALPAGATSSFVVLDGSGVEVGQAGLGDPVRLHSATGHGTTASTGAGSTTPSSPDATAATVSEYTLVITTDLPATSPPHTTDVDASNSGDHIAGPGLIVRLAQVRDGEGFVSVTEGL
ncbi:MAG: hypothetical protein LBM23_10525 [Propionibacteriaceae bacterium]|jgi:alternate signal-mediated exported protein|nr:hypothetical protein [Propionibacteriaceae bacterium]